MKYYNYYTASVYCPYQLKDLSCLPCKKIKKDVSEYKVITNDDMDTLALVTLSKTRSEIVVTYRGTMNVWNVILDALMINVNNSDCSTEIKMHLGFHIAAKSFYDEVVRHVRYLRRRYPNYKIIIAGQSLGAAMARVTYFLFVSLDEFTDAVYELYTYGEPRVGNKAFADFMNEQNITTARIVNRADIITHVPPTSILTTSIVADFYVHPKTEYWINGEYSRFCNQSVYEDPTCSDSLGPVYSVLDHATYFDANYLTCLVDQPVALVTIPLSILQPVGTIPPLPTKISSMLDVVTEFIVTGLSSLLGR